MDVSTFLGGSYLTEKDLSQPHQVWTIAKADQQLVGTDQKICITFAEFPEKALGLNKTNLRRVAELYGTDASAWIGKQLLVYRSTTSFQGATKLCVRVCGPQQAPPDPICDRQGNGVLYQPPALSQAPAAAVAPATSESTAPWEAAAAQQNSPPSA